MKCKVFIMLMAGLLLSCSSDKDEETVNESDLVTMNLSFLFDQEPMTKAEVSEYCTHLDVWLVEGSTTTDYHQSQGDSEFGSLSLTLNKTKTYTLYAVAHKCADNATLANGVISFPDDKVTHSFFVSSTFTPSADVELEMQRIVAQLRIVTTDQVPTDAKKMRITIDGVYDRWNVSSGGTHQLNRVSNINISSTNSDGSATFSVYAIVTDAQTTHDILVEALNANDEVLCSHAIDDVPLRNNYRTIVRGPFFSDAAFTFSFVASDWEELTTIEF